MTKPPRNPFRSQHEEKHDLMANPTFRFCYFTAVGILLIAVGWAAATTFAQLPEPHNSSSSSGQPDTHQSQNHRIIVASSTSRIAKGTGVRGNQLRMPLLPANEVASNRQETLPPSSSMTADPSSEQSGMRAMDDVQSHDEEASTSEHEEELALLRKANPSANSKILGETKEQVRQEQSLEDIENHHEFGLLRDNAELRDLSKDIVDRTDSAAMQSVAVQVLRRKIALLTENSVNSEKDGAPTDTQKERSERRRSQAIAINADDNDHTKNLTQNV